MTTTPDHRPDPVTVPAGRRQIGVYAARAGRTTLVPAVEVTAIGPARPRTWWAPVSRAHRMVVQR
jgi:hypothetical protein